MERVALADVDPDSALDAVDRQRLTEALATTDVAINRYRVDPGARLAGLHAHLDQEELFVVLDGELSFETVDLVDDADDDRWKTDEVTVGDGGAIRFASGEFQSGKNASTEADAIVLALGAPKDSDEFRVPVPCAVCGHDATRPTLLGDGDRAGLVCPDCGTESIVSCPECDSGRIRAVLDDDGARPINRCRDCGTEWPIT